MNVEMNDILHRRQLMKVLIHMPEVLKKEIDDRQVNMIYILHFILLEVIEGTMEMLKLQLYNEGYVR